MSQPPRNHIGSLALLVRDYDEAIAYFTGTLGFDLIEDTPLGPGKRWVLVAPKGSLETRLLLARADSPAQRSPIGHQAGGRVFLLLHTDDFWRDYEAMQARGVAFRGETARGAIRHRWRVQRPLRQPLGSDRNEATRRPSRRRDRVKIAARNVTAVPARWPEAPALSVEEFGKRGIGAGSATVE